MTALSVVIGARRGEGDERRCLEALEPQIAGVDVEIILVRDDHSGPLAPSWVTLITRAGALVPQLWAAGLERADGRVVAFTASTMIPGPDWIEQTLRLHAAGHVAVGGPIEPGPVMGRADWAVYFCRFSPYARPITASDALEVAADNGSYTREVLLPHAGLYQDAFLEPFIHRVLRSEGHRVTVVPDRVAYLARGHHLGAFCRLRFRHGRHHGRERSMGVPRGLTLLGAASAPAVPLLMTARAARSIFAKRRLRVRFLLSAPFVAGCYTAWAAGELVGRLDAALGRAVGVP